MGKFGYSYWHTKLNEDIFYKERRMSSDLVLEWSWVHEVRQRNQKIKLERRLLNKLKFQGKEKCAFGQIT